MSDIDPYTVIHAPVIDPEAELARLTSRYRNAGGLGIEILNVLGGQAEGLLERLPSQVRDTLDGATEAALTQAMRAAQGSRRFVGDPQKSWLNTAVATALGAAGGAGGLPGALAELPVTTAVLLRAIQDEAKRQGFDPQSENVQFDCVRVFAAAGPMAKDDGADLAFVSTRLALTGGAMQALIARVAPRLSVVLGQKLAAQAVPVLGAAVGAATNYAYTNYYQEIAHVHFGLRRLAIDADLDHDELVAEMLAGMKKPFAA
nr:EcsC family protein [Shimia abyssi]